MTLIDRELALSRIATLQKREHPLSQAAAQKLLLDEAQAVPSFEASLLESGLWPYRPHSLEVLQINVGRRCNQTCAHCHVDAGPDRREEMSDEVWNACLELLAHGPFTTLDITGGAPVRYLPVNTPRARGE